MDGHIVVEEGGIGGMVYRLNIHVKLMLIHISFAIQELHMLFQPLIAVQIVRQRNANLNTANASSKREGMMSSRWTAGHG